MKKGFILSALTTLSMSFLAGAMARAAVNHLLGLGHREVHHVTGPQDSQSALIRFNFSSKI